MGCSKQDADGVTSRAGGATPLPIDQETEGKGATELRVRRVFCVGISTGIHRMYRDVRRDGFSRHDAQVLCWGAVLYTGEGRVGSMWIPAGAERDALGRAEGLMTIAEFAARADGPRGLEVPDD